MYLTLTLFITRFTGGSLEVKPWVSGVVSSVGLWCDQLVKSSCYQLVCSSESMCSVAPSWFKSICYQLGMISIDEACRPLKAVCRIGNLARAPAYLPKSRVEVGPLKWPVELKIWPGLPRTSRNFASRWGPWSGLKWVSTLLGARCPKLTTLGVVHTTLLPVHPN